MSRGVLIHAFNNDEIDYGLISLCNALCIKKHLKVPVCLVSDNGTMEWLKKTQGDLVHVFDEVILQNRDTEATPRHFWDTLHSNKKLPWYNTSRTDSYALSPFDETLLIDSDYFVFDKSLNAVWGSAHDIMINRKAITLSHGEVQHTEKWIDGNGTGIEMCWATCVYFKKSEQAEMMFDLIKHIRSNYAYYAMIYGFSPKMFRNDYAFSIAVHMMSGFIRCDDIPSLPFDTLFTSFDSDDLIDVDEDSLLVLVNDPTDRWKFTLTRTKGINVHFMNKFAIIRQAKKFISLYRAYKSFYK